MPMKNLLRDELINLHGISFEGNVTSDTDVRDGCMHGLLTSATVSNANGRLQLELLGQCATHDNQETYVLSAYSRSNPLVFTY